MFEDSGLFPLACRSTSSCLNYFLVNQVFIMSQLPKVCLPCQTRIFKAGRSSATLAYMDFSLPIHLQPSFLVLYLCFSIYSKKLLFLLIPSALFSTVSTFADLISLFLAPTVCCLHNHSLLAACFDKAILKSNWMFLVLKMSFSEEPWMAGSLALPFSLTSYLHSYCSIM